MEDHSSLAWTSSSRTDAGMVRNYNEDACLERPDLGLWVVADGMGGHEAGDVASRLITDTLGELDPPQSLSGFIDAIESRLIEINRQLRRMAADKETHTIGSTVAALLAHGEYGACLWAGDSRVYRIRDGGIEQISQDHALVEELVEKGVLTREQAANHPQGNLVTRAVGATDSLFVDMEMFELRAGDRFILCSDGLDKEIEDYEIAEAVLSAGDTPPAEVLVDLALSRGSRDNVTVVSVEIHAGGGGNSHPPRADREDDMDTVPASVADR